VRVEISFWNNPYNYFYHIMTAVPLRDAVCLVWLYSGVKDDVPLQKSCDNVL